MWNIKQKVIAQCCTLLHTNDMLSYTLTPDLIHQLQELDQKLYTAFSLIRNLSEKEREAIHRFARISTIGASTRIENANLTDSEVHWMDTILTQDGKITAFEKQRYLIEDKLSKDRERSIEEVAGCRDMMMQIYSHATQLFPISETIIRGLHHSLMAPYQGAGPYSGAYKIQSNYVVEVNHKTSQSRIVFETAPPGPITQSVMHDLVIWYNQTLPQTSWTMAVACEFVFRFLAIHPFQDGNGRLGRGLFLLCLLQSPQTTTAQLAPYLAIDREIEKQKEDYYFLLNQCSQGKFQQDPSSYDFTPFIKFMIRILNRALEGIEISRQKYKTIERLPESALTILTCFREHPEIRLTTKQLIQETFLPRRTIIYALNLLVAGNLIQKYGQGAGTRYQVTF